MTAFVPVGGMADVERLLAGHPDRDQALDVDVDGARLAREIKHSKRRRIGLLPANAHVSTLPVAIALGQALAALTEELVLVLDPERVLSPELRGGSVVETVFAAPFGQGVCCLAPFAPSPTGAKVEGIKLLLRFAEAQPQGFGHVFADLSGCARPGELLGALRVLDGIIVVGPAGRCTEAELRVAASRVPDDLALGVLLVEAS